VSLGVTKSDSGLQIARPFTLFSNARPSRNEVKDDRNDKQAKQDMECSRGYVESDETD